MTNLSPYLECDSLTLIIAPFIDIPIFFIKYLTLHRACASVQGDNPRAKLKLVDYLPV